MSYFLFRPYNLKSVIFNKLVFKKKKRLIYKCHMFFTCIKYLSLKFSLPISNLLIIKFMFEALEKC